MSPSTSVCTSLLEIYWFCSGKDEKKSSSNKWRTAGKICKFYTSKNKSLKLQVFSEAEVGGMGGWKDGGCSLADGWDGVGMEEGQKGGVVVATLNFPMRGSSSLG